ncbi:MAG: hypothetical protein HY530_05310 [Chloroflexi bacterium]|nr:hypothetical protein [Chloroflexota bacterium]
MKLLKGLALSLLGLLLFLSLSTFGLAFTLNRTVLNPDFIVSGLNRLDVAPLIEQPLTQQAAQAGWPPEFSDSLVSAITELEPVAKERVGAAIYRIYDYLLGKTSDPDLAAVLGDTVLSADFITTLVSRLDISSVARELIAGQLSSKLPPGVEVKGLAERVEAAIDQLEPWLKEQAGIVAKPMLDYLLGKSKGFTVTISLGPVMEVVKDTIRQALLESPPPELAQVPPAIIEQYLDEYIDRILAGVIPATLEINERALGTETRAQIMQGLAQAEDGLAQARLYVGYFQTGYKLFIGFILLLVLGIIFLHRNVRGSTRSLGTTSLIIGASGLAEVFLADRFAASGLTQFGILLPVQLQAWLEQLIKDSLAPLQTFNIALAAIGVVLLAVSFLYRRGQPSG